MYTSSIYYDGHSTARCSDSPVKSQGHKCSPPPPDIINLRFGRESFPLHVREAIKAGVKPRIYKSETVATDIDKPEDLLKIETLGLGTQTYNLLMSLRQ